MDGAGVWEMVLRQSESGKHGEEEEKEEEEEEEEEAGLGPETERMVN